MDKSQPLQLPAGTEVLFLSNEGLGATIIESQVLSVARGLRESGVHVRVVVLALRPAGYERALRVKETLEQRYGLAIEVVRGVPQMALASVRRNASRVRAVLQRCGINPCLIHARTEYATAIARSAAQGRRVKVLWDCRGDTLGEHRFRWSHKPALYRELGRLALRPLRSWLARARTADGALFVSEALQSLEQERGYTGPQVVVPNFADPDLFRYAPALREETRARLDLPAQAPVLVYVGSVAPWQGFDAMRSVVEECARRHPELHMLVVSDSTAEAAAAFPDWFKPRLRVVTGALPDVPAYLNAADAAFLFKAEHRLSWVASPVKFAEYAMCGLPIIHNATVAQVSAIADELEIALAPEDLVAAAELPVAADAAGREARAEAARGRLSNRQTTERLRAFYAELLSAEARGGQG